MKPKNYMYSTVGSTNFIFNDKSANSVRIRRWIRGNKFEYGSGSNKITSIQIWIRQDYTNPRGPPH